MELGGDTELSLNKSSCKRMKTSDNGDWRPWSDLPEALLYLITKHLAMIDYLRFGCVCRLWKLYVAAYKQDFMASQPPLILFVSFSSHARKSCYFYNIFDRKISRPILPSFIGKSCVGITGGYLAMQHRKDKECPLWLINPITRHELHFPSSPYQLYRIILASLTVPRGDYIVVGFSLWHPGLQFCKSTDSHWTVHHFEIPHGNNHWKIIDGAFFQGKIYLLTSRGEIGVFDPTLAPYFNLLEVESFPNPNNRHLQLVASTDHLLLVKKNASDKHYEVYQLNFLMKSWIRVRSLGDQALFIGDCFGTLRLCTKAKWKGCEKARNCIFNISRYSSGGFTEHPLGGRHSKKHSISSGVRGGILYVINKFWYFPQLACHVDSLSQ